MSEQTKGGNIILSDVRAPDRVAPGDSFDVVATVKNGAAFIGVFDPDKCGTVPPGYNIEVVFEDDTGRRVVKGPDCLGTTEIGSRSREYEATFTAPEGGVAGVEAFVRLPGSGKQTGRMEASTVVSENVPRQPTDPGNDGGGGGGGDGGGGPFQQLDEAAQAAALLIGLLALAWLADSGADIVG